MIRVLIASRVRVFREALAEALSRHPQFRVLGTASHLDEVLAELRASPPDIVVIDLTVGELPSVVREIRRNIIDVKVIAITMPRTDEEVIRLAEAGVSGYVLPDGSVEDLVVALESAARGELHVSPEVAYRLLRRLGSLASLMQGEEQGPPTELSVREREIIDLINRGMSNKDIARHLGVEVGTAKNHVHNILKKLHVHRRIDAADWYRKAGFHLKLEG